MTRSTYCGAENPSKKTWVMRESPGATPKCRSTTGSCVMGTWSTAHHRRRETSWRSAWWRVFSGKDEDGEDTQMAYLRWFWCAQKMKHSIKDAHAREIFISDVYDACPLEVVEGCAAPV